MNSLANWRSALSCTVFHLRTCLDSSKPVCPACSTPPYKKSGSSIWRTIPRIALHQEAKSFFTRPLAPDWLCVFIDAKIIELKDEHDQVKQAVHFLAVGIGLDGKKEILTAAAFWGNEALEAWRKTLIDLKNRGLVRVLLLVTDDFSGLAPLIKSLFPNSDHQLCTVHLLRNAQRHLSLEDYTLFRDTWREIQAASGFESAQTRFRALLDQLRPNNKAWVEHLEKRIPNYLTFIKY